MKSFEEVQQRLKEIREELTENQVEDFEYSNGDMLRNEIYLLKWVLSDYE